YQALTATYAGIHRVRPANAYVTVENIAELFRANGVPAEPDLLSIDVDGNDYWLWEALEAYRPRVVVMEYNAAHVPPDRWVLPYDPDHRWAGDDVYGASLAALEELGKRKGYALLGTDLKG